MVTHSNVGPVEIKFRVVNYSPEGEVVGIANASRLTQFTEATNSFKGFVTVYDEDGVNKHYEFETPDHEGFKKIKEIFSGSCFGGDVRIEMWESQGKFIEDIRVGDIVKSFDNDGNHVPGRVSQVFSKDAKIVLNFHGTRVTPGHVYYRHDSVRPHKFETIIDILRDDGVIVNTEGVPVRAATFASVDGPLDNYVQAVTGNLKADGSVEVKEQGRIRLGTRFIVRNDRGRKAYSVADLIEAGGGVVGDDELIHVGNDPGMPFHWEFGDTLPNPEDFVLACSGTTLEDIYKAAEWESQCPRLPGPMVLDGGPVRPLNGVELAVMPRNEPLNLKQTPLAPQKPQSIANSEVSMSMEAKARKSDKN